MSGQTGGPDAAFVERPNFHVRSGRESGLVVCDLRGYSSGRERFFTLGKGPSDT
jgi:hypothetical protein